MKVILNNIRIIHPEYKNSDKETDILLLDGVINKIGKISEDDKKNSKFFDFKGKFIAPGFMDMHVHLREPGREDEETVQTGCDSAANGGFTAVACMPNTEPAIDTAEVVSFIKKQSANHLVNVYPVAAATVGRKGELISPMAELFEAGAVAFSDDGCAVKTSGILKRALEYSAMYGVPVIEHCEDESLAGGAMNESINSTLLGLPPVPAVSEEIIVMRDILMSEYTGGRIHIAHISTKKSVEMVRQAKKRGVKVTAEVTPHHFTLSDDAVKTYDTNSKMNPPLRTWADVESCIEGLKDGTIDCIASDHAPHSIEEKEMEFEYAPNGIIGLETELSLVISELVHKKIITPEQMVEKLSVNPRKILNIQIPKFSPGEAADFTIFDLDEVWTADINNFKSKSINTPFNKRIMRGKSVAVINNKKMFYRNEFLDI